MNELQLGEARIAYNDFDLVCGLIRERDEAQQALARAEAQVAELADLLKKARTANYAVAYGKGDYREYTDQYRQLVDRIDAALTPDLQSLAARQARLEEDSRLLDGWIKNPYWIILGPVDLASEDKRYDLIDSRGNVVAQGSTPREALRAAIDAARKEPNAK
jgi:hypothetical protein